MSFLRLRSDNYVCVFLPHRTTLLVRAQLYLTQEYLIRTFFDIVYRGKMMLQLCDVPGRIHGGVAVAISAGIILGVGWDNSISTRMSKEGEYNR